MSSEATEIKQTSPLLRLPAELQLNIYELVLGEPMTITLHVCDKVNLVWGVRDKPGTVVSVMNNGVGDCRNLVQTCSTIYKAALPILYNTTTFDIFIEDNPEPGTSGLAYYKLGRVDECIFLRLVKNVNIMPLDRTTTWAVPGEPDIPDDLFKWWVIADRIESVFKAFGSPSRARNLVIQLGWLTMDLADTCEIMYGFDSVLYGGRAKIVTTVCVLEELGDEFVELVLCLALALCAPVVVVPVDRLRTEAYDLTAPP